jgi:sigma-B regulation protein RsbU (phosphoserine phosphatase)
VLHDGGLDSSFVSAFVAVIGRSGVVRFVNAGHPPPLVVRGGHADELAGSDGVLGPRAHATFRARRARLGPGDGLVVFSDGIVERRDGRGAFFGTEGVALASLGPWERGPQAVVDAVFAACRAHGHDAPWDDDATALVVRRRPAPPLC